MATFVNFPESNCTWKGWEASPDREPKNQSVGDLRCFTDGKQSISCWKLSWWELLTVIFTRKVWLFVYGHHPPVYVKGKYPFYRKPEPEPEPGSKAELSVELEKVHT